MESKSQAEGALAGPEYNGAAIAGTHRKWRLRLQRQRNVSPWCVGEDGERHLVR
jgi:hypothetical protein